MPEKNSYNVKPLNDRVLVKAEPKKDRIGSILLPDNAREKPRKGELLACGAACNDEVKESVGKVVHFNDYSGCEAPGNPEYLYLRDTDILGVEI